MSKNNIFNVKRNESFFVKDIFNISRGRVISKQEIQENPGDYPVYSSQTENEGLLGCISSYMYDGDYLTWTTDGAYAGTIFFRQGKFNLTNVSGLLQLKEEYKEKFNLKYLYYFLSITTKKHVSKGMGNPKLMSHAMAKIIIKAPPIEVQEEIVRILDKFTQLEAELEAELEARIAQNKYYKNRLLEMPNLLERERDGLLSSILSNKQFRLEEICFYRNGKGHEKEICEDGKYIVINSKFISTNGKTKKFSDNAFVGLEIGEVVIVLSDLPDGRALAKTFYINEDEKYTLNQRVASLKVKDEYKDIILPRYLCYFLNRNKQLLRYDDKVSQTNLSKRQILKTKILVPPIEVQEKIAEILDKFDKLTNDMVEGLPAEIELVRKQYEYYRNKLLTFKEV